MRATRSCAEDIEWVSPPSETVLRLLHKNEIGVKLFREKTGLSVEEFIDFLHDKHELNPSLIHCLSQVLGGSELFWTNRYSEFKDYVSESDDKFLMSNDRFLTDLSNIRSINIRSLSDDFRVSNLEYLIADYYDMPQIMYSRNQKFEPSPAGLANWIRKCELIAEKKIASQSIPVFDTEALIETLPEILSLSKVNNVLRILPKIQSILASVGIILVLSPNEKGNGVSGFAKKIFKRYRLIVVTDRYKNNAAFWFTLLHELAHCTLHEISQTIIHYSDQEFILADPSASNSYEEEEANEFVESMLFPAEMQSELHQASKSYKSLIKLAVNYEISASLVVGQVHRMKLAPYNYFRKVYQAVRFESIF